MAQLYTYSLSQWAPASFGFLLPSITHLTILPSGNQVHSTGAAGMAPQAIAPWPWRRAAGSVTHRVRGHARHPVGLPSMPAVTESR